MTHLLQKKVFLVLHSNLFILCAVFVNKTDQQRNISTDTDFRVTATTPTFGTLFLINLN